MSLRLHDFSVWRDGAAVVADVHLQVSAGSLCALTGDNGSGKTTLLRAVAGLLPHRGTLQRPLGCLRYLPQQAAPIWGVSVREALHPDGLPAAPLPPQASDALRRFGLGALRRRRVTELSGGESARVLVARACADRPALLLADEPTAALDARARVLLFTALRAYCQAFGTIALVSTHDLQLSALADAHLSL